MHNSQFKAVEFLGAEACEFFISVYIYFHGWPVWWEEYEEIQSKLNLSRKKFLKHSITKWVWLVVTAAENFLEQWVSFCNYFLHNILKRRVHPIFNLNLKEYYEWFEQPSIKVNYILLSLFIKNFESQNLIRVDMECVLKSSAMRKITDFYKIDCDETFNTSKVLLFKK